MATKWVIEIINFCRRNTAIQSVWSYEYKCDNNGRLDLLVVLDSLNFEVESKIFQELFPIIDNIIQDTHWLEIRIKSLDTTSLDQIISHYYKKVYFRTPNGYLSDLESDISL